MKKFKLGMLCAILVISSLQVEATAEFIGNAPDKIRLGSGQNAFLGTKKTIKTLKPPVWIVQDNTVWK